MKKVIINAIILFVLGSLIHMGGDFWGNIPILQYFFPSDETYLEHGKLYTTGVLLLLIGYKIFGKKVTMNDICTWLVALVIMLVMNMTIFPLVDYIIGEHITWLTLIIYFVVLVISQLIAKSIILYNSEKQKTSFCIVTMLSIVIMFLVFTTHII